MEVTVRYNSHVTGRGLTSIYNDCINGGIFYPYLGNKYILAANWMLHSVGISDDSYAVYNLASAIEKITESHEEMLDEFLAGELSSIISKRIDRDIVMYIKQDNYTGMMNSIHLKGVGIKELRITSIHSFLDYVLLKLSSDIFDEVSGILVNNETSIINLLDGYKSLVQDNGDTAERHKYRDKFWNIFNKLVFNDKLDLGEFNLSYMSEIGIYESSDRLRMIEKLLQVVKNPQFDICEMSDDEFDLYINHTDSVFENILCYDKNFDLIGVVDFEFDIAGRITKLIKKMLDVSDIRIAMIYDTVFRTDFDVQESIIKYQSHNIKWLSDNYGLLPEIREKYKDEITISDLAI